MNNNDCPALPRREYGILLHPTSLPGDGVGDLGHDAHRFVDFLSTSGAGVWQVLPLGPTHADGSPYLALSAHAGNTMLISPQRLLDEGFVDSRQLNTAHGQHHRHVAAWREQCVAAAFRHSATDSKIQNELRTFAEQCRDWLPDYALYRALKHRYDEKPWFDWPIPLRDRHPQALRRAKRSLQPQLDQIIFGQYLFHRQCQQLKNYANQQGIRLFGDLPIFVSHDSADVWSYRKYFRLSGSGRPKVVAGVPPDYFSKNGQRWGNPLYDWAKLAADGFEWWVQRLRTQFKYFDLVRIDHFRGFDSFWEIRAKNATAVRGRWVNGPGEHIFDAFKERLGTLPLVAEDLGLITDSVIRLRKKLGLPGMRVLQFAFDGQSSNPHLPHNHDSCSVVYTGTHDNDTTLGWFEHLSADQQQNIYGYLGIPQEPMPWALIRAALKSVARLVMLPMQDVMGLGSGHRMNTPGRKTGNWRWSFKWDELDTGTAARLKHLASVYARISDPL